MIELLRDIKPIVVFIYELIDELDKKEAELAEVRDIARKLNEQNGALTVKVNKLYMENLAMKKFIHDHVPEEKQKLIFKEPSETIN